MEEACCMHSFELLTAIGLVFLAEFLVRKPSELSYQVAIMGGILLFILLWPGQLIARILAIFVTLQRDEMILLGFLITGILFVIGFYIFYFNSKRYELMSKRKVLINVIYSAAVLITIDFVIKRFY